MGGKGVLMCLRCCSAVSGAGGAWWAVAQRHGGWSERRHCDPHVHQHNMARIWQPTNRKLYDPNHHLCGFATLQIDTPYSRPTLQIITGVLQSLLIPPVE
jgi:hypothetical protein